ncbi:GPI-anchored protein [Quillaja saponaria]|uniref:GPI-anchored protein n=1 Tax=Quillaja saponaria TaxID=32244 RepID=A0AAD7PWP2_QUISA|nr:GPI-anchored protein [Quillaja saponaria]
MDLLNFAPMPQNPTFFTFFTLFSLLFPCFLGLPQPDPVTIQPLLVNPSPPATIPAFPEQSNVVGCPLDLSDELFDGIKSACGATKGSAASELHRSRCCPVLAAWLYSAYSATALGRIGQAGSAHTTSYDMPLLPDDSETCVGDLDKALKHRGIELIKPNETCDVVYCYCGIRLHPLSCPEAFSVTQNGTIVGDGSVKRLETDCLSSSSSNNNVNGFPGLGGCSKCLTSLYLLNKKKTSNSSKLENRTTKMHHKDCQLMGLTWLLVKNRKAYIHTVSSVLRAMMMSTAGSDPQSCTLNSDGMPLAVDSSEFSDHSSSNNLQAPIFICLLLLCLLHMHLIPYSIQFN